MNETTRKKPNKIFISHSSQDLEFVKPLVDLFEHIGLTPENMFCSSVAGYNIPLDDNIYDYLKKQFQNYDLRVIFILSKNYYNSPASMNEMGAAWVLQHRYTSVLLPQFDFRDVKGVIDQMRISIKLDSEKFELKARLNELRDTLANELGLKLSLSPQNIWERHRDEFVDKVNTSFMSVDGKQFKILTKNGGSREAREDKDEGRTSESILEMEPVKSLGSIQMVQKGDKNQQFGVVSNITIHND